MLLNEKDFDILVKVDYLIYNHTHPTSRFGNVKQYREVHSEMLDRCSRYSLIYQQIEGTKEIIIEDTFICSSVLKKYIETMDRQSMDSTDYAIADYLKDKNAVFMTDDHDFGAPLGNYEIMTSNQELINRCIQNGFMVK